MKICWHCKHNVEGGCCHPNLLYIDPVIGRMGIGDQHKMRKDESSCGPEGKWWEPKWWHIFKCSMCN